MQSADNQLMIDECHAFGSHVHGVGALRNDFFPVRTLRIGRIDGHHSPARRVKRRLKIERPAVGACENVLGVEALSQRE